MLKEKEVNLSSYFGSLLGNIALLGFLFAGQFEESDFMYGFSTMVLIIAIILTILGIFWSD